MLVSSERKRQDWPLARVEQVFPSEDGVIRSVLVFDGSHRYVRDPRLLLNLECDSYEELPDEEVHESVTREESEGSPPVTAWEDTRPPPDERSQPVQQAAERQRQWMREIRVLLNH